MNTCTSIPSKPRFRELSKILMLSALAILLFSCEDFITPKAMEDVRIASLPDRKLTLQAASNGTTSPLATEMAVKDGEPLFINATADAGFEFLFWEKISGTGTVIFEDETSASTTVRVTGGDAIIKARIDDTNYAITITAQVGGSVSVTSMNLDKGLESDGTIVATPSSGYTFTNWTISSGLPTGIIFNPDATTASVKITANSGDAGIQANFIDTQIPTGTIAIQSEILVDGTTYYSKTKSITVNLSSSDNSGSVVSMKLSTDTFETGTTTGWIPVDLSTVFTFPSDGAKTLYIRFKDAAGNESNLYTDTTIVDSTPPVPSRYQIELINSLGTYPLYVTTYNSNLQLNYLATDTGSGVQKVYFSRTATRPPVAQVTSYPTTPLPYAWSIADSLYTHNYYAVNFWFEDKLGNISAMYTDPVRYDDRYEGYSGNNDIDAVSGSTFIIDDNNFGFYGTQYQLYTYYNWGYGFLVDPDFYKWGFYALDSNNDYPVEIILDVNNGASTYEQMPQVTFYDHNGDEVSYTHTYPYGSNTRVKYDLFMPYIYTGISNNEYYFYMQVSKGAEDPPYSLRPNYDFYWTFTENEGM